MKLKGSKGFIKSAPIFIVMGYIHYNNNTNLLVNEKGDVGKAKCSLKSMETRDELQLPAIRNKSYVKVPVSA